MDNAAIEVVSNIEQHQVSFPKLVELSDLQLAMIGGGIADIIGV